MDVNDTVRSVPDVLGGQRVRAVARPRRTVDRAAGVQPCAKADHVRPIRAYARRRDARAHRTGIVESISLSGSFRGGDRPPPRRRPGRCRRPPPRRRGCGSRSRARDCANDEYMRTITDGLCTYLRARAPGWCCARRAQQHRQHCPRQHYVRFGTSNTPTRAIGGVSDGRIPARSPHKRVRLRSRGD
jgi:hypothetical protein